ncbi:MAG: hypothetical protein HC853_02580, partial [Anaerolineae bacterium]|nr:hypothetical protein [Anaerolineae bacterium]
MRAALNRAMDQLEAVPPPTLHITLLGEFSVRRGEVRIAAEAWSRPAARQLLQYFCLHRGERLRRTRVLREVWPDNDPTSAASAFRTVLSRLGHVIEPYLRSRAPLRYFEIDAETICFDPQQRLVQLDSDAFLAAIAMARSNRLLSDAALSDLIAALEAWRTPLHEVRYADWAQDFIEYINAAYVDGCVRVAEVLAERHRADGINDLKQAGTLGQMPPRQAAPLARAGLAALIRAVARQTAAAMPLRLCDRAI